MSDRRGEGQALIGLSLACQKLGNLSRTLEYAEMGLQVFEEIEDPRAETSGSKYMVTT
jgi:hypothetical protein